MLDYTKLILSKVSFDEYLFTRELEKAIVNLDSHEIRNLQSWLQKNYGIRYRNIIDEYFEYSAA